MVRMAMRIDYQTGVINFDAVGCHNRFQAAKTVLTCFIDNVSRIDDGMRLVVF